MKIKNIFRRNNFYAVIAGISVAFVSCKDDSVGNYYTFTGETVGQYLETRPEYFSEFCNILDTTNVMSLLKAYGKYTCFAPTNEGMRQLYKDYNVTSYRQLSDLDLKKIANDHVIKDYTIRRSDFTSGRLSQKTMNDRYISVSLNGEGEYLINEYSLVLSDLSADSIHNGVVYALENPLQPTEMNLAELIEERAKNEGRFKLFARALKETLLCEELHEVIDESYDPTVWEALEPEKVFPQSKKYGYTALIESDSVYYASGVISMEKIVTKEDEDKALNELIAYAKNVYDQTFPEDKDLYDNDLTHKKNPLNKFIAYHLHNKQMNREFYGEKHFNKDYTKSMSTGAVYTEYVETMCHEKLMAVTYKSNLAKNLINGTELTFLEGYTDKDAVNGVYHELTGVLQYDRNWLQELTTTRLRMDVTSFYPELTNNGYRYDKMKYRIPQGYVKGLEFDDNSKLQIIGPDDSWRNFCGEEMWTEKGSYDVKMTTLNIPAGTYEVRVGYQASGNRGVCQFYFDGIPSGIPLDMNMKTSDSKIGYVTPSAQGDSEEDLENDKVMKNRGYMKGPTVIYCPARNVNARYDATAIRRIMGIYTFDKDQKHVLRMKSVSEGEFMIDYMEFVPTEILEKEYID